MNILKEYREKNQYNYKQMADLLNISKTYYWQIENHKRRLSYYMAFKISILLNTRPDTLFFAYYEKLFEKENKG